MCGSKVSRRAHLLWSSTRVEQGEPSSWGFPFYSSRAAQVVVFEMEVPMRLALFAFIEQSKALPLLPTHRIRSLPTVHYRYFSGSDLGQ